MQNPVFSASLDPISDDVTNNFFSLQISELVYKFLSLLMVNNSSAK